MIFACFTIVAPMIVILIVSSNSDEVVATLVLLLFSWKGFDATLEVTADSLETLPETDRYWLVEGQICRWRWVVYFTWRWMTIALEGLYTFVDFALKSFWGDLNIGDMFYCHLFSYVFQVFGSSHWSQTFPAPKFTGPIFASSLRLHSYIFGWLYVSLLVLF